jgi:hypothetical protein
MKDMAIIHHKGACTGNESSMPPGLGDMKIQPPIGGVASATESTMSYEQSCALLNRISASPMPKSQPVVRALQTVLKQHGQYSGVATGVFGPKTRQALFQFQKANKLAPSEVIDDKTRRAILSACSGTTTSTTPKKGAACSIDGKTIRNGESVIAYDAQGVDFGMKCSDSMQKRTCKNGVLSGSADFKFTTCSGGGGGSVMSR